VTNFFPHAYAFFSVVFIPIFIMGLYVLIFTIILPYIQSRKRPTTLASEDKSTPIIAQLVMFIIVCVLVYTTIGLLIRRLSEDSGYPPAGIILIPVFIVLSLLLCCVGCCLPCLIFMTRMSFKAGLDDEESGNGSGMAVVVPVNHRITNS
jgi:uncharacterized membrane protein YhaH (DUF805 family)